MICGAFCFCVTMSQQGTILDWWIFKIPVLGFLAFICFFISVAGGTLIQEISVALCLRLTPSHHEEMRCLLLALFLLVRCFFANHIGAKTCGTF